MLTALVLAQTAGDVGSYLAPLITVGAGGWGVMLLLILTNRLHPDGSYRALEAEKNLWREAAEKERAARERAEERADVAVETSKVANEILNALKRRASK